MKIATKNFKTAIILVITFFSSSSISAQSFCYPDGNVVIYSNYDGGFLNINVDQHIPNLKIGITTYEKCEVHFSGAYVSDITEVIYAGYNGNNDHCNPSPPTTSINGVPSNISTVQIYPPVTWTNSNGYYLVICNYSCDSSTSQGGCNTPDQIAHYYLTQFGGSLYFHYTQYGCWSDTKNISEGGNCCIGASIIPPQFSINASFSLPNDTLCAKVSVPFINTSFNNYGGGTSYSWNFGDGTPEDTNSNPVHIYGVPGNYTVTLIATNSTGTASDTSELLITLVNCFTALPEMQSNAGIFVYPNPVTETCTIHIPSDARGEVNLRLYDGMGRCVLNQSAGDHSNELIFEPKKEHIASGMYNALIDYNGNRYQLKILIE